MGQLENIQTFIRIVDSGGIGRAAEQLNLAKSAVSRRLVELETQLGTQLLIRSTRRLSLTSSGQAYYQRAVQLVDELQSMNAEVASGQEAVSGTLRIAAPLSFGLLHLSPALDQFAKRYPELDIHIDFSDRLVDLIEEGRDLAFRIANLKDSSYQARQIAEINILAVASPTYLEEHGAPQMPSDLHQHSVLKYPNAHSSWSIKDTKGHRHQLNLPSRISANNGDFLEKMAIAGHGIALIPSFLAWKALLSGELVQVLQGCTLPQLNVYALYPNNRYLPLRTRLLIDFMLEWFGETPYWDKAIQ